MSKVTQRVPHYAMLPNQSNQTNSIFMKTKILTLILLLFLAVQPTYAMHIMEGYLPLGWCVFWYLVSIPFVILSYKHIQGLIKVNPRERISFALNAAFVFILSALKLPSVTGSSSHLTGTTLGTLTMGVMSMPLVGFIVLLFQALLLAHGGISTLGANIFSLAIAGPLVAYLVYNLLMRLKLGRSVAIFMAAMLGSLATYVTTSIQLAIVFPDAEGGVLASFIKFVSIFAVTQVPLSIVEGFMTVLVMNLLVSSEGMIEPKPITKMRALMLSALALICVAIPLVGGLVDFGSGTDDQAGEAISILSPQHEIKVLFQGFEPSEWLEPLLFAFQVSIGIALFTWAIYALRSYLNKKH